MAKVEVLTLSAACEVAVRHDRCRGQVVSLLAPAGQLCGCPCHGLEAEHVGEVA